MKKMVFISNNWFDTHQQLRLNALSNLDLPVECLAFLRSGHPIKSKFTYTLLGNLKNRRYSERLISYFTLLSKLPNATRSAGFIYIFGFDLLLITLFYQKLSNRKFMVVYEIPDIRELFFSKRLPGKFLRWLERLSIPNVDLLVVTSQEYVTDYFEKWRNIPVSNYLVIENKLHKYQENNKPAPVLKPDKKIRIGYFGYLRCPVSLECLFALANFPQFEIILAGIFTENTDYYKTQLVQQPAITYLGSFDGSKDMPTLYNQIDYVWAIYPYSIKKVGNHHWARTNRFYESLYFKKPAIVQKGSADAGRSHSLGGIAVEIDLVNKQNAVDILLKTLNPTDISKRRTSLENVPPHYYTITSEYEELSSCLNLTKL